jgi:signal transduction histidine kinase
MIAAVVRRASGAAQMGARGGRLPLFASHTQAASRGLGPANPVASPLRISTAALWACVIALGASTQYLFQPFVWANWPWDEVMAGWLDVVRDRTVLVAAIAFALVAATRIPVSGPKARAVVLAIAIVLGALAGELILFGMDSPDARVETRTAVGRALRWGLLGGCVTLMYYLWQRTIGATAIARSEELRLMETERQIVQARLQVLRTQIEPHFLFNTLATVRRLHQAEPDQGAQILHDLVAYLRMTISTRPNTPDTLRRELDLIRAYLGVVSVRMSGRLETCFEVPDALLDCEFPALTLATLVENAVKHGIGPKLDGGMIQIVACRVDEQLEVVVADTGVGFSDNCGTGIGLANIRARLRLQYGQRGVLGLRGNMPHGVRAVMRIPCMPVGAP